MAIVPNPNKIYEITVNNHKYKVTGVQETRPPFLKGEVRYSCNYAEVNQKTAHKILLTQKEWETAKEVKNRCSEREKE